MPLCVCYSEGKKGLMCQWCSWQPCTVLQKKWMSHLAGCIIWQNIIPYVGQFRWLRITWFIKEFRRKETLEQKGINSGFLVVPLLTHFRDASSRPAAIQGFDSNLLKIPPLSSITSGGLSIHKSVLPFLITNKKNLQWEEDLTVIGRVLCAGFRRSFCACQMSSRTGVIRAQRDFFQSGRRHKKQRHFIVHILQPGNPLNFIVNIVSCCFCPRHNAVVHILVYTCTLTMIWKTTLVPSNCQ